MNRGEKNRASECIVAIHKKGLGKEAIRYVIAKLDKSSEVSRPKNRGEMNRASECLVLIGRYNFSKEAIEYIIAGLTKSIEKPLKDEERTDDE